MATSFFFERNHGVTGDRIQSRRGTTINDRSSHKSHGLISLGTLRIAKVAVFFLVCVLMMRAVLDRRQREASEPSIERRVLASFLEEQKEIDPPMTFAEWRKIATDLAALPASETIHALESNDPFGVRQFEKQLLEAEAEKGSKLSRKEFLELFPCPEDRISLPDVRNHKRAEDFRRGDPNTFLFFQNLNMAGGDKICELAERNLPKRAVPEYMCMPDIGWRFSETSHLATTNWSGKTCAGCLHHWSNQQIIVNMREKGHRIAGNEWDNFDPENHFDLPAVFATSFRKPLDRALSQFRFECIEDRGCKIKEIETWWEKRVDLSNVFTRTFSDTKIRPLKQLYESTSLKDGATRAEIMGRALDSLSKFHLVLVMEWLAYAGEEVERVLGFRNTSPLTKRVRPHIGQYKRNDGQDENKLGAAGIAKASWVPKDYLSATQYKIMSENLALDEVLTDAGRRLFLERLACEPRKSVFSF